MTSPPHIMWALMTGLIIVGYDHRFQNGGCLKTTQASPTLLVHYSAALQSGNEGSFEVKISILACHFTRSFIKKFALFQLHRGKREIWIEALDCNSLSLREIDALCVSYTYTKMMPRAHIDPSKCSARDLQIVFRAPHASRCVI